MAFLSKWEKDLLSALVSGFEAGDFNCGASITEMESVNCPKDDEHIIYPPNCRECIFGKRFDKLKRKVGAL